jgi:hypothetical protein
MPGTVNRDDASSSVPVTDVALSPVIYWLAAVKLAVHLVTIRGYGWFRDEFYYIACSERLDWGYVDHPPLVALVAAVTRWTLGESIVAFRLPAAVAGAATVVMAGVLARELGGARAAQGLAALGVLCAIIYLPLQHILSMNAWEPLTWTLCAWLVVRALTRGDTRWWVLAGVVAGVGLQSKHSMLFFGFALACGLLLSPARRVLATRGPWIMGVLAAAIVLPNVIWQIQHGWPTLEFMQNAQLHKNRALPPLTFLKQQLLMMNPIGAAIWAAGLGWLLLAARGRALRAFGWAYLVLLGLFLVTGAKDYYLTPYYPILFAAGGVALERWSAGRRWRLVATRVVLPVTLAVTSTLLAPLALPVLPVDAYVRYARALGVTVEQSERHEQGRLPQFFADMFGWHELVDAVVAAAATLPPGDRERAVILVRNYGEAGAIDFLGRARGAPPAISGHNSYWHWGPGRATEDILLILGGGAAEHDECGSLEQAAFVSCTDCMPYQNNLPIWVCRNLSVPIDEAWRGVKHYN